MCNIELFHYSLNTQPFTNGYNKQTIKQTNSVAFTPLENYTDWTTATWWHLVPSLVDRGMSRDQRGGSPTVVILSFLDRSGYFSFK
jgi:hypothetical protein